MKEVQSIDVANFFLSAVDKNAGDLISNLKMQKLVYYAQGIHLAMFDEELFSEEIKALEHGIVVPELYNKFKSFGRGEIEPNFESFDIDIFTQNQKEMLQEVYATFGQFSTWMLRNMTHKERPYVETTIGSIINKKLLTEYFKTQIF